SDPESVEPDRGPRTVDAPPRRLGRVVDLRTTMMKRPAPLKFKSGRACEFRGESGGSADRDEGREPVPGEQRECTVEGELAGVVRGDLATDHHVSPDFLDGQVADSSVRRLSDPYLDLLDQRGLGGGHGGKLLIVSMMRFGRWGDRGGGLRERS